MKKVILSLTAVIITLMMVVSCAKRSSSDSYNMNKETSPAEQNVVEDAYGFGTAGESNYSTVTNDSDTSESGITTDNRKIIKNSEMTVETKSFDSFISTLESDVEKQGGYIENKEINGGGYDYYGDRDAQIVIRIPSEKLELFKQTISKNGNVTYEKTAAADITSSYNDIKRHIESLETEQTRLLEIMKKADKLSDILDIEERLTKIRYELDSYEQRLNSYDEKISYSTLNLWVIEVERESVTEDDGFFAQVSDSFSASLNAIGSFFKVLFIALLGGSPIILLLGAIALVVILIVRSVNKKNKTKQDQTKQYHSNENSNNNK